MSFEVMATDAFEQSLIRQATPIMERRLNEMRAKMIEGFNAPKSGRESRRPGGDRYRASAPGEPPARRSGGLERSIGEPNVEKSGGFLVGFLKIEAHFAGYLERGTPRILPRPFARPAVEEILRGQA
jgi:hypothetical protein